jgi:hypothetical protein
MKTTEKSSNHAEREFIPEATENIAMGAKVFSEKASDIFNTFIEKVKETAEAAYEKGSEIYENVALKAQEYVDRFRDRSEMANLEAKRDEVAKKLGSMCFMEYSGRYRFRVEFMKSDEFRKLIAQMRELDKEIIKIGERLDAESR